MFGLLFPQDWWPGVAYLGNDEITHIYRLRSQDLPIWFVMSIVCLYLNPACSSLKVLSTSVFILCNMTLHRILLGIDKSVMPLQLLQRNRSPFFGSFTRQSSGICSSFHILLIM